MTDLQSIMSPVNVLQAKRDDLSRTQPIGGQEKQHGVVAQANRPAILACTLEKLVDFFRSQRRRDAFECIHSRTDYGRGQIRHPSGTVQLSQETAQVLGGAFQRSSL